MNLAVLSLVYTVGLLGTVVLVPGIAIFLLLTVTDRRHPRDFGLPVGMLCGFIGGALLIWNLLPPDWTLPLGATLEASADTAPHGHPIEHYEQIVLVWLMFGAVVGSVAGGFVAAIAGRLLKPRRLA